MWSIRTAAKTKQAAIKNLAGRIKTVTDESGDEEREYGKLGEVTRERHGVNAFNNPVAGPGTGDPVSYFTVRETAQKVAKEGRKGMLDTNRG